MPVDVQRRVGLGVALALGGAEGVVKGEPLGFHAREDVVAGAVEDAEDALDAVANKSLA